MKKGFSLIAWCLLGLIFQVQGAEIDGFWKNTSEKTGKPSILVAVYEYQEKHYGRILATYDKEGKIADTIGHAKDQAPGVKGNPCYAGLDFIWDLTPKGSRYKGKIMDPSKGRIYDVELWVEDGNLIVRGEVWLFGRNQTWPAATDSDFKGSLRKPDVSEFVPVIPEPN